MLSTKLIRAVLIGLSMAMLPLATASQVGAEPGFDFVTRGADKALDKQLRGASLVAEAFAGDRTTAQDLYAAARADYGRLLTALYAEGYYGAAISIRLNGQEVADIAPLDVPDSVSTLSVQVDTGPQFHFRTARMRPYAPGTDIPSAYGDSKIARATAISDAAQAGVDGWRNLGYAKARVTDQNIVADHPAQALDSLILLDSGPKLRFGELHLVGNTRVTQTALARIAGFPTGKPFNPKMLDRLVNRTLQTGAFSSAVLTEAERPNADGTLDVTLTVAEQKRHRIGYGAEIASLDGATVTAYWIDRNVFGGAERLRIDLGASGLGSQTGGRDLTFGARLERPATVLPDITAYVDIRGANRHETDYREKVFSFSLGAKTNLGDVLTGEAALSYSASDVTDAFGKVRYRTLALPVSITRDRRDVVLSPTKGYYLRGDVKPFLGFSSTGSGLRAFVDARAYRSFGVEDGVVLAGRVQAGTIFGPTLLQTPRDDLFYSGGAGTVRGQPYQSLGVQVLRSGAQRTGGMSFLGVSGEVRLKATEKLGVVGFADAGYVSSDSAFSGINGWQGGVGVGLRYDTGIGPVRFDVAVPAGGNTGNGMQVYIGIGQAF